MKTWVSFGLVMVAAISNSVYASKIIGNGGNVIVCNRPQSGVFILGMSPSATLLDFYEAEKLQGITIQDPGGRTYQEKVHNLLNKVASRFPELAKDLKKEFNNFEQHQRLIKDAVLEDTTDAYFTVLPRDCHIEQVAIQRTPMFPRDPWFLISQDLWDGLSELGRAGLALHESLYRIGLRSGVEHSRGIRYLVGLLFSADLSKISDRDWIAGFLEARIRDYELYGVRLPLFTGNISPCDLVPGDTDCHKTDNLKPATFIYGGDMLSEVDYEATAGISFVGAREFEVSMLTRQLKIDHGINGIEISLEGTVQFCDSAKYFVAAPGLMGTLMLRGRIRPIDGHVTGSLLAINGTSLGPAGVDISSLATVNQFRNNSLFCSDSPALN